MEDGEVHVLVCQASLLKHYIPMGLVMSTGLQVTNNRFSSYFFLFVLFFFFFKGEKKLKAEVREQELSLSPLGRFISTSAIRSTTSTCTAWGPAPLCFSIRVFQPEKVRKAKPTLLIQQWAGNSLPLRGLPAPHGKCY